MADSIIMRGQAILENQSDSSSLLQVGAFQTALLDLIQSPSGRYMEQNWESYLNRSAGSVVDVVRNATKDTKFPLDRLSVGKGLFYQYSKTGNSVYRDTLSALRISIDLQPRNEFGGLWYYVYPNWSYLDGMFSLFSFYTVYTPHFDIENTTATASWANPTTGASPIVWGRALGWFMMGLVDFLEFELDLAPIDFENEVATWHGRFVELSNAILQAVDPVSGAWWQVLSAAGREGNYIEASVSAMFSYTLLKGVRLGLLNDTSTYNIRGKANTGYSYTSVAARAYRSLVQRFVVENTDGTLSYNGTVGVCSLNSTASYEYYVTQPLVYDSVLGSAAFVRASVEYELQHGNLYS
ncbi:Six-hairpin glycosidase-like protein [Aspergillus granulosus]|uniref:Six-hairpin glycosidase-like protein n=1 Tax=Aspergillus granulosus TaxID=176169 RepID=A0ABR4HXA2_9EURO